MEPEFIIPLKKEDLLRKSGNCYSVNLIDLSDASHGVRDLKFIIEKKGSESILKHFDSCFSYLYDVEQVSFAELQDFYQDTVEEYLETLNSYVERSLGSDPTGKKRALTVTKMILYLFSTYVRAYEEKLSHQNSNLISEPKRARMATKVKGKSKAEESWPWHEKKTHAFSLLEKFLALSIGELWQTKIVEETFVNMIAGCCYKALENTEINLVKSKLLRDSICRVLSVLVVNYNHTLTFLPRVVELMKQYEHSAAAVANAVLIMHKHFSCNTILQKVLNEFLDIALEDPQTMGKPISVFLNELGEHHPELFTTSVDILMEFLSVDAYSIRNAVMVTFCEMITRCFSEEDLINDTKKIRNTIIEAMLAQIHDESAYVRSKVVHLWAKLAAASCIPVNRYVKLLREIKHRLQDKSTYVSKNSINFFTTALQHNPYGGELRSVALNKKRDVEMAKLKELMDKQPLPPEEVWASFELQLSIIITEHLKTNINGSSENQEMEADKDVDISDVILIIGSLINQKHFSNAISLLQNSETIFPESREIRCNIDRSDQVAYYLAALKKIFLRAAQLSPQTVVPEFYENSNKIESTRSVLKYLDDCINFIECINKASEIIFKLMFSTNTTEVLESIEFFSTAYKFHMGNSEKAVRDMLLLVNSTTPEIKDAVAKAYGSLYLETSRTIPRARAAQIAHRLIYLVKGLDQDQKMALEELLQKWVESNQLDKEFVSVLLETVVLSTQEKTPISDRNASLFLINMIADVNNSIVSGNISHLKSLLEVKSDNYTIKLVCSLLQKLAIKKNGKPLRYKTDNEIFQLIINILLEKFTSIDEPEFVNMSLSIINLIFHLSYKPDELSNDILCNMYRKMIDKGTQPEGTDEETQRNVSEVLLDRLFIVCGHILFMKWQYCDRDVFNCLKRCHDGMVMEKNPDQSIDEFEMDADNVVAADDALYEEITSVCEKFLCNDETAIQHISNMVLAVCKCQDDNVTPTLKASAALALAKFMCTSVSFCEGNFQLYVTLMDRCKYETVRSGLVLGFGDLLCRFPNTVEPWTQYLYSRLKDHSELVRVNTISVLCHLISREMIKVRGQFAELLLHLEDPHPIIAEKVNSLLQDLSRKGNTVYNVIPDIISKLSNPDRSIPVASSTFQLIITKLFELVTKERQSDLLVDKLCSRLRESTSEKQWEFLSYCLSQIRYTEKSLRKLTDSLPTFRERLANPTVHDTITTIINNCAKSTKTALKEAAQEASERMEEVMTSKDKKDGGGSPNEVNDKEEIQTTPDSDIKDTEESMTVDDKETTSSGMKTPDPIPTRSRAVRKTATKVPRSTTKNKPEPVSRSITRSTRKKRNVVYCSSDEDS